VRFLCAVPQEATECRLVVGRLFREQVFESSILSTPTIRRRNPNWQRCPSQKRKVEGSTPSVGTNESSWWNWHTHESEMLGFEGSTPSEDTIGAPILQALISSQEKPEP
jgi:hypothetical protein